MLTDEQINKAEKTIKTMLENIESGKAARNGPAALEFIKDGNACGIYMIGEENAPRFMQLIETIRTLQQQNKQLIEHMGWASRIIDSVMYSPNPPSYDPDFWFMKYHELLKGGTSNDR